MVSAINEKRQVYKQKSIVLILYIYIFAPPLPDKPRKAERKSTMQKQKISSTGKQFDANGSKISDRKKISDKLLRDKRQKSRFGYDLSRM